MKPVTLMAALCLLAGVVAGQTVRNVPGTFPTIQAGIDAASTGDTVLVAPGVYTEQLSIQKGVAVVAAQGPDVTHIVGGLPGAVITVSNVVTGSGPTVEGFTIRDGVETGIVVSSVIQLTLRGCDIRNNTGKPGDSSQDGFPGALLVTASNVMVDGCRIRNNVGGRGGDSVTTLQLFCTNGTDGGAGAIYAGSQSAVMLMETLICDNTGGAGGDGFATACPTSQGGPQHRGGHGGVGAIEAGLFNLLGVIFSADFDLLRCTVAGNAGGAGGGGANPGMSGGGALVPGADMVFENSIVWGNTGGSFPAGSPPMATWSDIEGGVAGTGNIAADPQFADPSNGDYHLTAGSPAVDAADPAASGLPLADSDGHPRVWNLRLDMGWDEFAPLFAGTGEDFELRVTVDGLGADVHSKPALGNEGIAIDIVSPGGVFIGCFPILVLQSFATGTLPFGVVGLPELHFDPNLIAVLFNGSNPGFPLPPTGISFGPVTPGTGLLTGFTLRFQAIGITPLAGNGIYGASDAEDIVYF